MGEQRGVVSAIVVVVVLVLLMLPASSAGSNGSRAASSVTSFPVSYGIAPKVPSSVGAQGHVGVISPVASLGPIGTVGLTGQVGPVNDSRHGVFARTASTLEVQVFNGTLHPTSAVVAVADVVKLQNLTDGTTVSAQTNTHGFVNLSAFEGWYLLTITQQKTTFINFTQQFQITTTNPSIIRYMMPIANATVAVNNGPVASRSNVVTAITLGWSSISPPQWTVSLENVSTCCPILASAVTGSNGTATFTGVDTAFQYRVLAVGYSQTATGVVYANGNNTGPNFNPVAGTNHPTAPTTWAWTTTTATVTGTALPTGGSSVQQWGISADTTISGGTVNIGATPYPASGNRRLVFSNDVVWFNAPDRGGASTELFIFRNSTVVFLSQDQLFAEYSGLYFNNSAIYGGVSTSTYGRNGMAITHGFSEGSLFTNGTPPNTNQPGWGGTYYNSKFSAANISDGSVSTSGVYKDQLGATLINCDVENVSATVYGWENLTSTKASYSLLQQNVGTGAETIRNSTYLLSSDTPIIADTAVNLQGPATMDHVRVGYSYPVATPAATYLAISSQIAVQFSKLNITNSILNGSSFHRTIVWLGTTLSMFNDLYSENLSVAAERALAANATTVTKAQMFNVEASRNLWANDTTFDGSGNYLLSAIEGNATYTHDLWPYFFLGNAYAGFSTFTGVPSGYIPRVLFSNDVFGRIVYDAATSKSFATNLFGPIGMDWFYDTNFNGQPLPIGVLGINSSTFDSFPFGPYNLFAPGDILIGANGVTSFVNNDAFLNSVAYASVPISYQNGTNYIAPFGADVNIGAGTTTVSNDWFLNLTNQTLPVEGVESTQASGWKPVITLSGDHFYYYPSPLQTSLDPNGPLRSTQIGTGTDRWLSSQPTVSTLSYEIPLDKNGSLSVSGQTYELVSNTSNLQTTAIFYLPANNGVTSTSWSYSVAPDVNVSGATPKISYANGLQAGPQPNFWWHGYNYSEKVETDHIAIGVNSSNAPSVSLGFSNLVPSTAYVLSESDASGNLLVATPVTTTGAGTYTTTFTPTTTQLSVIFSLAPASGPSGCVSNCQPTPGGTTNSTGSSPLGLVQAFAIGVAILLIGLAIVAIIILPGRLKIVFGVGLVLVGILILVAYVVPG